MLEKEIEELTNKFRNQKSWSTLRELAGSKGINPSTTLLVGFLETEDELEYGVFFTELGEFIEYCRSTVIGAERLKSWIRRRNLQKLADRYPAVGVCLK